MLDSLSPAKNLTKCNDVIADTMSNHVVRGGTEGDSGNSSEAKGSEVQEPVYVDQRDFIALEAVQKRYR